MPVGWVWHAGAASTTRCAPSSTASSPIATEAFEEFDHARALETAEQFFWTFCDDYLELVKERAYGAALREGQLSAVATLRETIEVLLLLFAPFLPFATEEVWSWTHDGSVHTAAWPEPTGSGGDLALLPLVSEALIGIRRAKTDAKASQKTDVVSATLAVRRCWSGRSMTSRLWVASPN